MPKAAQHHEGHGQTCQEGCEEPGWAHQCELSESTANPTTTGILARDSTTANGRPWFVGPSAGTLKKPEALT